MPMTAKVCFVNGTMIEVGNVSTWDRVPYSDGAAIYVLKIGADRSPAMFIEADQVRWIAFDGVVKKG